MHLLIPHASSLSEACTQTLKDLQLPHLTQLLRRLSPTERNESDEYSLSPPHERALAQALGFAGPDGGLPWAAYLAARDGVETQDLCWGLLTPMHWHVGADHVTMVDPQALQLDEAESRELLEAVRPLFESEGWLLIYGAPTRWYGAHESLADLPTASPDRVIGRNVDLWMPDHPQARLVRRLQNEVQMLLYTHPCTDRRVEQGRLPVNTFWLSGCGPSQPERPTPGLVVDERLRDPLLAGDWPAWAEAWRSLDAGPVREALLASQRGEPVSVTLCGERHWQRFERVSRHWLERLRARFRAVDTAALLCGL
ncbi:hypothetical protein IS481_05895 [Caldimonas thermodepolymerans]|jgi:Uncharacterized protein conserved in bacteria|uniref:Phosphoglycerate mutase n=1 Tax=Caldimonas thermodepolymerans TaxID=215580 RepID=A0A2S5T4E4_9BURK|nr:hypothetical protein [Caldimonas thermodepolymerans]PPE69853.1 hypothetical protein C1702_10270 [Caldimonas thermodepolymerans]QPC32688.1 hypothetical protein IS481_05895 [Caldimonas thermodepolymerans]RDI03445.1 hypothetical protein DES46_101126 [Caldimonas thermodepolymerans]TCP06696.1 hypothetical protein EV676_106180 [Caldimonas thermodepolymerans]UZG45495.1 hypothetical protein ONZ46_05960 [Caldimonas thermodepolymerans]